MARGRCFGAVFPARAVVGRVRRLAITITNNRTRQGRGMAILRSGSGKFVASIVPERAGQGKQRSDKKPIPGRACFCIFSSGSLMNRERILWGIGVMVFLHQGARQAWLLAILTGMICLAGC